MPATPEELLDRFLAAGDVRAMEELVAATRPQLAAAVRGIGAPQDADDTVQNAYHSLLRRVAKGPLDAPVLPWLLTAAVRIAYRRRALARRETAMADRLAVDREEIDPAAAAAARERDDILRREVAALPGHYRDALLLHHLEGLSVAEIAKLLDVPAPTVKARLQRGRRLLGSRLSPSLLYALFFVPWWCADSARAAATGIGVTMKAKTAAAVLLILALALTGVVGVWGRGGRGSATPERAGPRTPHESVRGEALPAAAEGGMPARRGGLEGALPEPVDLATVDLDHDLHGIVVDRAGAPIAGAELATVSYPWDRTVLLNVAQHHEARLGPVSRSARDGTFRIRLARGAKVNLRVSADGFAPVEKNELQAGERVRVTLTPGVALAVLACDEAGAPVPGVRLRIFPAAGHREVWFDLRALTDDEGSFRYENLPPGVKVWLDSGHDRLGNPGWQDVMLPAEGETRFDLRMVAGRTIAGRVTDASTGLPIEGARVGKGWTYEDATATDAEGRYTLSGWTGKGTSEIAADAPDYGEDVLEVGAATEVHFALLPGRTVLGRAVDARGRPVAGAIVAAIGSTRMGEVQKTSKRYGTTDGGGRFALAGLRPDIVHALTLIAPGHGRTLTELAPREDTDLGDIVMADGRAIEGRVVEASGAPVARVEVTLRGANADRYRLLPGAGPKGDYEDNWYGNTEERRTDHLGRFRFPDLAPGEYALTVRIPGRSESRLEVTLPPERERVEVEFKLAETREFTVLAHDTDGRPLRDVVVNAYGEGEGGEASKRTGADGKAVLRIGGRILQLYAWVLPIEGQDRDYLDEDPITDVPEAATEAKFVFRRAARIAGRIVLPDGAPVTDAEVEARDGEECVSSTVTDALGRFSLKVPPEGRFDVVLRGLRHDHPDRRAAAYSGDVRGVAAGTKDVILTAKREAFDRTLRVRVEGPDGAPVPEMRILAVFRDRSDGSAETDANGVANLADLPPGAMKVYLWPKTGSDLVSPTGLEVTPEGQEIVVRLEKGVPVTGTVMKADGAPMPRALVLARQGEATLSMAQADAQGRFTVYLPGKPDGPVSVSCGFRNEAGEIHLAEVADVRADGGPIRLVLRKREGG